MQGVAWRVRKKLYQAAWPAVVLLTLGNCEE
jgi:hypothetical protein